METTFYHDDGACLVSNNVKKMKSNMTLDFGTVKPNRPKQEKLTNTGLPASVLASPDLNMLKLASPELERLIIQQNGMVTTTPTPGAGPIPFPKSVTEEQEAYARGFVDALAELHEKQGTPLPAVVSNATSATSSSASSFDNINARPSSNPRQSPASTGLGVNSSCSGNVYTTLTNARPAPQHQQQIYGTNTQLPGSVLPSPVASPPMQMMQHPHHQGLSMHMNPHLVKTKEEPQTVPCLGSTPPLSPINMENQEVIKTERKRARNRVAARKCRQRKLERISRLDDRVSELKNQNQELVQTATALREHVFELKRQIMQHVNSGCQLMLSPNVL